MFGLDLPDSPEVIRSESAKTICRDGPKKNFKRLQRSTINSQDCSWFSLDVGEQPTLWLIFYILDSVDSGQHRLPPGRDLPVGNLFLSIFQLDKRVDIEPCSPTATIGEGVFFLPA